MNCDDRETKLILLKSIGDYHRYKCDSTEGI